MKKILLFTFLLVLGSSPAQEIAAQKRMALSCQNHLADHSIATFIVAKHELSPTSVLIRLVGYGIEPPAGEKSGIGWDFFPNRKEKILYFVAIAPLSERGTLLRWATPERFPSTILPVPALDSQGSIVLPSQEGTIDNSKRLKLKEILLFEGPEAVHWQEGIQESLQHRGLSILYAPCATLQENEDCACIHVKEQGNEILFEIRRE